jgi:catechol-2,3-dioxygenase
MQILGNISYAMPKAIHPDVRIGHVHLKVADLERAYSADCL